MKSKDNTYKPLEIFKISNNQVTLKDEEYQYNKSNLEFIYFSVDYTNSYLIFKPTLLFFIIWDYISILLILYQCFMIPFRIFFIISSTNDTVLNIFEFTQDFFFLIDIIINFNLGYISKGVLVLNRKRIFFNYVKFWFWLDFISSFPFQIFIDFENYSSFRVITTEDSIGIHEFVSLLRIIKIVKLFKLKSRIYDMRINFIYRFLIIILGNRIYLLTIEFIKIFIFIIIFIHWISCIWYYFQYKDSQYMDSSPIENYINSFYFIFITVLTIGYGDISPSTSSERIFISIIQIISGLIFSMIIANIGSLMNRLELTNTKTYLEDVIDKFLVENSISVLLRKKIYNYLNRKYILQKENIDNDIFLLLNDSLKQDILLQIHENFYNSLSLLTYNLRFLEILIPFFIFENVYPNEVLFEENSLSNKIYFLNSGGLLLYMNEFNLVIEKILPDSSFGYFEFFGNFNRRLSCQGEYYSLLTSFDIDSFNKAKNRLLNVDKDEFDDVNQFFLAVKESIDERELDVFNYSCSLCSENDHFNYECPRLIDKDYLMKMTLMNDLKMDDFLVDLIYSSMLNKVKIKKKPYFDMEII